MAKRSFRLAAALAGFLCGLAGTDLVVGQLRKPLAGPHAPLLFSVELRDAQGDIVASPLLVGEEGKKLHLSLSQPPGGPRTPAQLRGDGAAPGLQMSLELDPQPAGEQAICLGYRLSVDSGAEHEGRLGVTYGEHQSVELRSDEQRYTLRFTVARAGSRAFERLLRTRSRPLI
jgi:hypothetical protein